LADDALVALVGFIGAPTASIEKLSEGTELLRAMRLLEEHLECRFDAVGIIEIGGANAMGPLVAGLQAGLPTIDADGMGRAFPEVQMLTFVFQGNVSPAPFVMTDAGPGSVVVPRVKNAVWAERLSRNLATSMGASAGWAGFVMRGAQVKAHAVPYTLSLAHSLGRKVLEAQARGEDVPQTIAKYLSGRLIVRGKITDVLRRMSRGFARGSVTIEGFGRRKEQVFIEFQNEFLIAYLDDVVVATVPDLICIVTEETGEPVTTEVLHYGTRVAVLVVPAAAALKTPAALEVVGPQAFGYRVSYNPVPGNSIGLEDTLIGET
jgi:DUF917 family protein